MDMATIANANPAIPCTDPALVEPIPRINVSSVALNILLSGRQTRRLMVVVRTPNDPDELSQICHPYTDESQHQYAREHLIQSRQRLRLRGDPPRSRDQ